VRHVSITSCRYRFLSIDEDVFSEQSDNSARYTATALLTTPWCLPSNSAVERHDTVNQFLVPLLDFLYARYTLIYKAHEKTLGELDGKVRIRKNTHTYIY